MKNILYTFALIIVASLTTGNMAMALPTLSSSLTPPAICDSTVFSYTPTSATPGTTFTWTRAMTANIANAAASGTDNPNEVLDNLASFPVPVTYVYTLSDGTSTNTQSVVVYVNPTPRLSNPPPYPICSGAVFTFVPVSATLGYTFSWSRGFVPGIANLAASGTSNINEALNNGTNVPIAVTYVFTVTANGCSHVQNVILTVNPIPAVITGDTNVCVAATTALTSITPGGFWNSANTIIATVGATTGIVTGVAAGYTNISYSGVGGCVRTREVKVNACTTAINALSNTAKDIVVYPNPASGIVTLNIKNSGTLGLYSMDGRMVRQYSITEKANSIDLAGLPYGMYTGHYTGDDGSIFTAKLIYEP